MSMNRFTCLAAVTAALLAGSAVAQSWQPIGADGGLVSNVVSARDDGGRVYAVAENGLHISEDAGRNWRAPHSGVTPALVSRSLVVSPLQPSRLFALGPSAQVLRSDDSGENWTPTGYSGPLSNEQAMLMIGDTLLLSGYGGVMRSTDLGTSFALVQGWPADTGMSTLAERPGHPGEAIAGVYLGSSGTAETLYRTVDGGASWTPVMRDDSGGHVASIEYFGSDTLVALVDGRLLRSNDNGATWATPQLLLGYGSSMARVSATQLIVINQTQCLRSDDLFVTQHDCSSGLNTGFLTANLTAVNDGAAVRVLATTRGAGVQALDPQTVSWSASNRRLQADVNRGLALVGDSGPMFTGQFRSDNGASPLLRSADDGVSWTRHLGPPYENGAAALIRSIAVDPTTIDSGFATVYASGRGRRMPANLTTGGIYKSTDGGVSWLPLNSGLPAMPGTSASGVSIGTVRKVIPDPRSCDAPPAAGPCTQGPLRRVFAISDGFASGVYDGRWRVVRSDEAGANWTSIGLGLPEQIFDDIGYESVTPIDLEFDPDGAAIYLSVYVDFYNDDNSPRSPVIASGVYRSSDRGASWTPISNGLPLVNGSATTTRSVFALAVHPRRSGVLWASTVETGQASRLYRSDDAGANWTALAVVPDCDVRELQVAPEAPQVLLAAGAAVDSGRGCLLRSEDGGASWTALHGELPGNVVYDVRRDPGDARRLVVAGQRGVWAALAPADRIFTDLER